MGTMSMGRREMQLVWKGGNGLDGDDWLDEDDGDKERHTMTGENF